MAVGDFRSIGLLAFITSFVFDCDIVAQLSSCSVI